MGIQHVENIMKIGTIATIAIALSLGITSPPARAQENLKASVSLSLQDAPVRRTVEAIFKQAGIKNYVIDNEVAGFVTLTLTEQPLESALKLVMRASSLPLTYTVENGVWIVKPRHIAPPTAPAPPEIFATAAPASGPHYERINLTYLDPADLDKILGGIVYVRQFTRQGGTGSAGTGAMRGNGGTLGFGTSGIQGQPSPPSSLRQPGGSSMGGR